jgi:hypothetical protein
MTEQSAPALSEEQAIPAEQAVDIDRETTEQSEQAAFEVGGEVKEQADEIGNTVDKASGEVTEDLNKD